VTLFDDKRSQQCRPSLSRRQLKRPNNRIELITELVNISFLCARLRFIERNCRHFSSADGLSHLCDFFVFCFIYLLLLFLKWYPIRRSFWNLFFYLLVHIEIPRFLFPTADVEICVDWSTRPAFCFMVFRGDRNLSAWTPIREMFSTVQCTTYITTHK
jgi:hypothetical protein